MLAAEGRSSIVSTAPLASPSPARPGMCLLFAQRERGRATCQLGQDLALSPHRDPLGENGLIHEHRKALKQEEPVLDFA